MVSSYTRRGSGWILGKIPSLKQCSRPGTAAQSSGGVPIPGSVQEPSRWGTLWWGLLGVVGFGWSLALMTWDVFSNLSDAVIPWNPHCSGLGTVLRQLQLRTDLAQLLGRTRNLSPCPGTGRTGLTLAEGTSDRVGSPERGKQPSGLGKSLWQGCARTAGLEPKKESSRRTKVGLSPSSERGHGSGAGACPCHEKPLHIPHLH